MRIDATETNAMDGSIARQTFAVTGMHCGGCVKKVTDALRQIEGVAAATVTLNPPEARLETRVPLSEARLRAALAPLGKYHVSPVAAAVVPMAPAAEAPADSLYPLFLILGYLTLAVALAAAVSSDASAHSLMANFMGGFFLIFSFFKLLDLAGFADAYRSYDLLAQRAPMWGTVYPFVELGLGIAYLLRIAPVAVNLLTLMLMLVGAAGVWTALQKKQKLRCACLGTAPNLPMTTVTLVEDAGMATMAAVMLLTR
jgi:copper chaperone CopZ